MKNNTTNMQTVTSNPYGFKTITIDPQSISVHELLIEMGYDHEIDDNFSNTAKHFSFYSKPVVDTNNKAVTNIAEIYAAKKNGLKKLEVFVCDLQELELKRFIAFTHKYHRGNLIASYNTIQFYREHFKTEEGKMLYAGITGKDTRQKIATLLNSSDKTIGRLMEIGDNKPEKLGLIQEGELSMKEVMDEIKAERLERQGKEKAALRKKEEETQKPCPTNSNPDTRGQDNRIPSVPLNQEDATIINEPAPSDVNDDPEMNDTTGKSIPFPFFTPASDVGKYSLIKGIFEVKGLGTLEIQNEGDMLSLSLDGKPLGNSECDQQLISMNGSGKQRLSIGIYPDNDRSIGIHINIDLPSAVASKRAA